MSDISNLFFKKKRELVNGLTELLPELEIDPASFFVEPDPNPGEIGYKDPGCTSKTLILLPGPEEANGKRAHLHIEERFASVEPYDLTFYRYEICWGCDVSLDITRSDHATEIVVTLKRGMRFDHHPKVVADSHHPTYHWHPNGCSEVRLKTGQMSALKVATLAVHFFGDRTMLEAPRFVNLMKELSKDTIII